MPHSLYAIPISHAPETYLQLHAQRLVHPQSLPDTQVQHNLLATTRNSISPDISIQPLDLGTLSTATITQPTENLTRFSGTELESRGALRLETCNGTTELEHGFHVAHLLALVDEILHPGVGGFDLSEHMGELETDDGVFDEFFAKSAALVGVFHGFFVADAGEAETLDNYADSFVAVVGHDCQHSSSTYTYACLRLNKVVKTCEVFGCGLT